MSSMKKLPPEVARELMRHVSAKPLPRKAASDTSRSAFVASNENSNRMGWALAGCLALTGTTASFPLVAHWWVGNLSAKDDPLTAPQVRRGAFQNSGTRDVGKDPNWDFEKGMYKKSAGYYEIYNEERNKSLPAEYHASPELEKHAEGIEAFAKGWKRKNEK